MSRLQIRGSVKYADLTPAVNASVKITDLDLIDNQNDTILNVDTNSAGNFSGQSSEWNDTEGKVFGINTPDILNLRFRVTASGGTHNGPFILVGNNSAPIVLPFNPPKPVARQNRALVQIISLAQGLVNLDKVLYEFIEQQSRNLVNFYLNDKYSRIYVLFGTEATFANFRDTLNEVTANTNIRAVDVIDNLHGTDSRFHFHGGSMSESSFVSQMQTIPLAQRKKFRAVFSTACYGQSCNDSWRNIGFDVAAGSEGIYADSAVSFAPFLSNWANEKPFGMAVTAANEVAGSNVADDVAKAWYTVRGYRSLAADVDSDRIVNGNVDIRIYSMAS